MLWLEELELGSGLGLVLGLGLKHILLLSFKCTIGLGTSYINLVHSLHTIML